MVASPQYPPVPTPPPAYLRRCNDFSAVANIIRIFGCRTSYENECINFQIQHPDFRAEVYIYEGDFVEFRQMEGCIVTFNQAIHACREVLTLVREN